MTDNQQHVFLTALARGCTVSEAASAARVSSSAAYALRQRDPDFAEAWRIALEDSADLLEAEARARAVQGVAEPVIYQGAPVYEYEHDASGQVIMERYDTGLIDKKTGEPITALRPKVKVKDGKPVPLVVYKKSDALLALLLKGRRKDVFADRTELTGANGGPVQMNQTERETRLASIFATLRKRKSNEDLA